MESLYRSELAKKNPLASRIVPISALIGPVRFRCLILTAACYAAKLFLPGWIPFEFRDLGCVYTEHLSFSSTCHPQGKMHKRYES
jgi:hypothetical protein